MKIILLKWEVRHNEKKEPYQESYRIFGKGG